MHECICLVESSVLDKGVHCFLNRKMLGSMQKCPVWLHSVLVVTLKIITLAILQEIRQRHQ